MARRRPCSVNDLAAAVSLWILMQLVRTAQADPVNVPTYFMEELCSQELNLSALSLPALELRLTSSRFYQASMDCTLDIAVTSGQRLMLTIEDLDVQGSNSRGCVDFLQLLEANATLTTGQQGLTHSDMICGSSVIGKTFVTSGGDVTLRFKSDDYFSDEGFVILVTPFHTGACAAEEFRCRNKRCVSESLTCGSRSHCGDGSDLCGLGEGAAVAILVTSTLIVLVLLLVCSVLAWKYIAKKQHPEYSNRTDSGRRDCLSRPETSATGSRDRQTATSSLDASAYVIDRSGTRGAASDSIQVGSHRCKGLAGVRLPSPQHREETKGADNAVSDPFVVVGTSFGTPPQAEAWSTKGGE